MEREEPTDGPSGDLLRAIVDRIPALVFYADSRLRCLYANRAFEESRGAAPGSSLGRALHEVLGEAAFEAVRPHVEAALAGREVSFEDVVSRPGEGARWMAVTYSPDRAPDGAVRGFAALAMDVSAHKTALAGSQASRREGEARLRAILDSAVDAIIIIDERGAIQSFNPAAERLFGYTEDEVLDRNVSLLMPSPYRDEHDGYLSAYRRTGDARIIGIGREVVGRRKTGETFPVHLSVGEARLGQRRMFTGIIRDLTEHKALQEQLAQSQKMQAVGRLAGGVAHDFNNILLTILGRTEAGLKRLPARHALRHQLLEIQKAGRRAASLTKQLLALSRRQVLHPRVIDLNGVLRDTAQMLRRAIGEDVELRMDLSAELAPVNVDADQIVQVVLNLVVNARDAMPRGGKLTIETRNLRPEEAALPGRGGPGVLLAVEDTGSGIDEETQRRIFEPYFTTKGEKGTGLGLATVYGIVEQSGGTIRVISRLGEGSAFRVVLPAAEGKAEPTVPSRAGKSAPRRRGSRVLLVEDDTAARRALEEFLAEDGHKVLSAGNGAEAERLWNEHGQVIDIIVTDTVMPRMSGPELIARLRATRPELRAVFMSGHTPETVEIHGGTEGTAFLQKPFEVEDLLAKVRELTATGPAPARSAPKRGRRR